jgi:hypothetical protein
VTQRPDLRMLLPSQRSQGEGMELKKLFGVLVLGSATLGVSVPARPRPASPSVSPVPADKSPDGGTPRGPRGW